MDPVKDPLLQADGSTQMQLFGSLIILRSFDYLFLKLNHILLSQKPPAMPKFPLIHPEAVQTSESSQEEPNMRVCSHAQVCE